MRSSSVEFARDVHFAQQSPAHLPYTTSPIRRAQKGTQKAKLVLSLLFYLATMIMIVLSSIPGSPIPMLASLWHQDTLVHVLGYLVFSVLLFQFLRMRGSSDFWRCALIMMTLAVLFAVVDEIHQIPIRNRDFDLKDLVADLAGIGLGLVVAYTLYRARLCLAPR